MDNVCKNCKYYTGYKYTPFKERTKGTCDCDKFVDANNKNYCEDPLNDRLEYWEDDDRGCGVSFNVGENFGCIHFETKGG